MSLYSGGQVVSIIIPVYNVERYVERCINSAVNQTYTNLQIIIVNDGSTDSSLEICEKYKADKRVCLVSQKNSGLSAARNTGLNLATGKYVFFLDSDDYIDINTIEVLLRTCRDEDVKIACCAIEKVYDSAEMNYMFTSYGDCRYSGKSTCIKKMLDEVKICTVTWNKLFLRCLFDDVRFPEGKIHEDEFTTYRLLYKAENVAYTDSVVYHYYQRENSIIGRGINMKSLDFLDALEERIAFFSEKDEIELVEKTKYQYLDYIKYLYRKLTPEIKDANAMYLQLVDRFGKMKHRITGFSLKKIKNNIWFAYIKNKRIYKSLG